MKKNNDTVLTEEISDEPVSTETELKEEITDALVVPASEGKEICVSGENHQLTNVCLSENRITFRKDAPPVDYRENKKGKKKEVVNEDVDFSVLKDLSYAVGKKQSVVKDECCAFEIKDAMSKMGKVVVRYNVSDKELEKILLNSVSMNMSEILLSPAYVRAMAKSVKKKSAHEFPVGTIIDFPFGESTFRSKLASIKESVKLGVDTITVMMPNLLLEKDKIKTFKKQIRAIGKIYKHDAGVCLAAGELKDEQLKSAVKIVEKSKVGFMTFAFGETPYGELKTKIALINKFKGKKPVKILGNVEYIETATELFNLGVEKILTPFADDIGKDLISRFDVKSIKIV